MLFPVFLIKSKYEQINPQECPTVNLLQLVEINFIPMAFIFEDYSNGGNDLYIDNINLKVSEQFRLNAKLFLGESSHNFGQDISSFYLAFQHLKKTKS